MRKKLKAILNFPETLIRKVCEKCNLTTPSNRKFGSHIITMFKNKNTMQKVVKATKAKEL